MLLDLGSTLYYVTPYMAVSFGFKPKVIFEPFFVSIPIGDSIVARRVYKNYVVSICNDNTTADLTELDMLEFDAIYGMDWLYSCYTFLDCRT